MGARTKLNAVYVGGSLVFATGVGLLSGSWTLFGISFVAMIALNMYQRNIRGER